jgi:hypothetical protein
MDIQWIASPYSLPLDDLYAQDPACPFLHNDVIYVGVLRLEAVPEDLCYVVVPRGAAAPQRLRGSTVVPPVMPGPLPRYL